MKTDPTPQVTSAAGTPLSHAAVEFDRNSLHRTVAQPKPSDTISDTLETSDREADGRQTPIARETNPPAPIESQSTQESTGDRLDLTG